MNVLYFNQSFEIIENEDKAGIPKTDIFKLLDLAISFHFFCIFSPFFVIISHDLIFSFH